MTITIIKLYDITHHKGAVKPYNNKKRRDTIIDLQQTLLTEYATVL